LRPPVSRSSPRKRAPNNAPPSARTSARHMNRSCSGRELSWNRSVPTPRPRSPQCGAGPPAKLLRCGGCGR
jgi:hypothetical protein